MKIAATEALAWAERLETIAGATIGAELASRMADPSATARLRGARDFRDELGHSRAIDLPVLLHAQGFGQTRPNPTAANLHSANSPENSDVDWLALRREMLPETGDTPISHPDLILWWALLDSTLEISNAVREPNGTSSASSVPAIRQISIEDRVAGRARLAEGPDGEGAALGAIEVWTETELRGLHALWWHAHRTRNPHLASLVESSRRWLIDHIQPDNATNRPWGAHVFLLAGFGTDNASHESRLFAETLIHNCQVTLGRADSLSAWILIDSARALRAWAGET